MSTEHVISESVCDDGMRLTQPPALRSSLTGLLGAFGRDSGNSKPSTRAASPTADRGDNSKGAGDVPPQKSAKKGSSRWGRVRGVAKVMGLQKRAQL